LYRRLKKGSFKRSFKVEAAECGGGKVNRGGGLGKKGRSEGSKKICERIIMEVQKKLGEARE